MYTLTIKGENMEILQKRKISAVSATILTAVLLLSLIANYVSIAEEKHYTFTIYVDDHSDLGHAFIGLSDGTDTQVNGFYGITEGNWDRLRALFGGDIDAAIADDSNQVCKHDASITWNITEEQYNALKQKIQETIADTVSGELKYNLYSGGGGLSCISFATTLAEFAGLTVPEYIKGGRLPDGFEVPDPKALYKSLKAIWWASGLWGDNATVDLHSPTGTIPGGSGGTSRIIDTGINDPGKLGDYFDITIDQQYLPPKMGDTDKALGYTHPIAYINSSESFVFWDFGDAYTGVIGSPLDESCNYEVYHSFDEVGTYDGTLLIITNTTLHHFSFTTEIWRIIDNDRGGGGDDNVHKLACLH